MKKDTPSGVAEKLAERHEHWRQLYENGCSDPFYPDGVNLNLVRNHIISYRRQLEELCAGQELPPEYYMPLPPEVDDSYMARADEIRETAARSLEKYLADRHYIYIKAHAHQLPADVLKRCSVPNVLNYAGVLREAINSDDLVTMRRHSRPEIYLEGFASCENRIRNEMQALRERPQQSLFSYLGADSGGDDSGEDYEDDYELEEIGMI